VCNYKEVIFQLSQWSRKNYRHPSNSSRDRSFETGKKRFLNVMIFYLWFLIRFRFNPICIIWFCTEFNQARRVANDLPSPYFISLPFFFRSFHVFFSRTKTTCRQLKKKYWYLWSMISDLRTVARLRPTSPPPETVHVFILVLKRFQMKKDRGKK